MCDCTRFLIIFSISILVLFLSKEHCLIKTNLITHYMFDYLRRIRMSVSIIELHCHQPVYEHNTGKIAPSPFL